MCVCMCMCVCVCLCVCVCVCVCCVYVCVCVCLCVYVCVCVCVYDTLLTKCSSHPLYMITIWPLLVSYRLIINKLVSVTQCIYITQPLLQNIIILHNMLQK